MVLVYNDKEFQKRMSKIFTSVYISITSRCNLKCRHCSERDGIVLANPGEEEVVRWIKEIAKSKTTKKISFLGGEPLLYLDELANYIKCVKSVGLMSSVITNGYWASTKELTDQVLDKLSGLNSIIVSSDKYHLEFINKKNIDNLINACLKRNINISINVTAASKEEGEEIRSLYENSYSRKVQIILSPMFCYGAAEKLEIEKFNYIRQPQLLNSYCEIRNHSINCEGKVYACCGASLGNKTNFLYLGDLRKESYEAIIKKRNESVLYRFMDEMGPSGLNKIISESPFKDIFSKTSFSQGCELCRYALNNHEIYNYIEDVIKEGVQL